PPGRTPVDTRYVTEDKRENVYMFMRRLFSRGRQGYVVCPLIDDGGDENESRKSVEKYADELKRSVFPEFNVEILHGRMKSEQKDDIMRRFASGEITLLVSTTVIEVGVNVPNAAIMVIENCERFGLSQLHQLRGRVGRGNHKSYCVLFSQSESEDTKRRIEAMCNTNDGFKIAEADLALRGPGDLLGERQSGLPAMRLATLGSDIELMTSASAEAKRILSEDPTLTSPGHRLLREYVEGMIEKIDNR
ncbi:MAG: ATP-dependent DNA helicase RecG, partial [Clostridiales bacterium]|nr:ATP-dependent DNA helicase RecG [Clostridiales bacterium]